MINQSFKSRAYIVSMKTFFTIYILTFYVISCRRNEVELAYYSKYLIDINEKVEEGMVKLDQKTLLLNKNDQKLVFFVKYGNYQFILKVKEHNCTDEAIYRFLNENKHNNIIEIVSTVRTQKSIVEYYKIKNLGITLSSKTEYLCKKIEYINDINWQIMQYLPIKIEFDKERSEEDILKILYDILKGIYHLHQNNILHSDLKLDNILGKRLEYVINYVIINFDCAKKIDDKEKDLEKESRGTYNFMAPEVFFDGKLSLKADIFSFGAICFYLYNNIKDDYIIEKKLKRLFLSKNVADKRKVYTGDNIMYQIDVCVKCKQCELCLLEICSDLCFSCRNCKDNTCEIKAKQYFKKEAFLYKELLKGKRFPEHEGKKAASPSMFNKFIQYVRRFLGFKKNENDKIIYMELKEQIDLLKSIEMNIYVKNMMITCLHDFKDRPAIIELLLDKNTSKVFGSMFKTDDFPGLKKKKYFINI